MSTQAPPRPQQPAILGGVPTNDVDTPISALLIGLFACSAITHMTIYQRNLRLRKRRFVPSAITFGFSMARIVALTMRIVWAHYSHDKDVALAASVFAVAGVILLFILNLLFTQRLFLARHAESRPNVIAPAHLALKTSIGFTVAFLVAMISVTVLSFLTTNPTILHRCRTAQRVGGTFMAVVAFLPLPLVSATLLLPVRGTRHPPEEASRITSMAAVIVSTSALLALGAGFRAGISYKPTIQPAWYHHRACYYVFNYGVELVVVLVYALMRVDRLFYVPGPGEQQESSVGVEKTLDSEEAVSSERH